MSTTTESRSIPWYLWPFWAIWRLLSFIVELTGRLVAVVLGLVLMIVGALVSLTVIGAVIGVPLILIGFLLVLRGFF
jgi:hypothetical protein